MLPYVVGLRLGRDKVHIQGYATSSISLQLALRILEIKQLVTEVRTVHTAELQQQS